MQVYRELRILTARPSAADEARRAAPSLRRAAGGASAARPGAGATLARRRSRRRGPPGGGRSWSAAPASISRRCSQGIAPIPPVPTAVSASAPRAARATRRRGAPRRASPRATPTARRALRAGDTQRLIRAYEVVRATGRPLRRFLGARRPPAEPGARAIAPAAAAARGARAAIDARCAAMLGGGALDEVARAAARCGLDPALPAMKAVGVPSSAGMLAGEIDAALRRSALFRSATTRQYAKRQRTWFRHPARCRPAALGRAIFGKSSAGNLSFIRELR